MSDFVEPYPNLTSMVARTIEITGDIIKKQAAEIERLQVLSDRYGLALMMIREGGDDPREIARRALGQKP